MLNMFFKQTVEGPVKRDALTVVWRHHIETTFERLKNAYEFLNLRALKISMLNKNRIFQCMDKIFCVEFQGTLWNSTQNILPIYCKLCILFRCEDLKALRFKSPITFLKGSPGPLPSLVPWPCPWVPSTSHQTPSPHTWYAGTPCSCADSPSGHRTWRQHPHRKPPPASWRENMNGQRHVAICICVDLKVCSILMQQMGTLEKR